MLADAGAGPPIDARVDRAMYDAVRPLMGDLAHEVSLCLRYYSVTFRGAKPEGCVLSGGEASEPKLVEAFKESLRIACDVGRPLDGVRTEGLGAGTAVRGTGAEWGVAMGLSLRPRESARAQRRAAQERRTGEAPTPVPVADAHRREAA
jgi:Tfp pilus assembly PilM family ATPase